LDKLGVTNLNYVFIIKEIYLDLLWHNPKKINGKMPTIENYL